MAFRLLLVALVCAIAPAASFGLIAPRASSTAARSALVGREPFVACRSTSIVCVDAAIAKEVDAAKKADEAKAKADEEKISEEEAAAKAEEERKKAEEAAKKKAAAEAKKKAEAEAAAKKAAEEKAESIACFSDASLVLVREVATVQERIDYLTAKGIDAKSIKAAMDELGVKAPEYKRDAYGRIIAPNDTKFNPNVSPPKADAFGQMRK